MAMEVQAANGLVDCKLEPWKKPQDTEHEVVSDLVGRTS